MHTQSIVFLTLFSIASTCAFAQSAKLQDESYIQSRDDTAAAQYKPISLSQAIEQGYRENFDQQERNYQKRIIELDWKDAKEEFWMPTLQVSLETSPQRLARLKNGSLPGEASTKSPAGTLGLEIGEYTIFNWGKDYLAYQNQKTSFERGNQRLEEQRRELRHDIIIDYLYLLTVQDLVDITRDQLRHASFIYRLNRERISAKKVSSQDYFQARQEYLKAQSDYQEVRELVVEANKKLAQRISDQSGTRYVVNQSMVYGKLKLTASEADRIVSEKNPDVLSAKALAEIAQREEEILRKENLPLPKISVNLGAYNYRFGSDRNSFRYETTPGSSDIDVVATVNATWSINGEGGFLNGRKTKRGALLRGLARKRQEQAAFDGQTTARELFEKVKIYEAQVEILEARSLNAVKQYDVVLENYMNKKARFSDFQHAMEEKREARSRLAEINFEHAKTKVLLARTIGIEDFPGERFEKLVTARK
ncbi:MAG: TolC family protein [bacterium]